MILRLSIRILILLYIFKICFGGDCSMNFKNYECRSAAKTPYRCVANCNDTSLQFKGCQETKIWLLVRHGTRYIKEKYISSIKQHLSKLQNMMRENYKKHKKTLLKSEDYNALEKWEFYLNANLSMNLMEEGENELIDIAERYQSRFPSLMPEIYSNKTYKFKFTNTQRTNESAKHFAIGLFGYHQAQNILYPPAEDEDPVLRFYKLCKRWQKTINKNLESLQERDKFRNSTAMQNTLQRISQLFGYDVDYDTAKSIYQMCAYEFAWNRNNESLWCKILSIEDFKAFEFLNDLENYWKHGYGYPLNYQQACPVMQDMFTFFETNDDLKVTAYFSHSGVILKLLSFLGIAKDRDTLRSDNYLKNENARRAWRTSLIDAFASNIAFVKYQCGSKEPRILTMHQERIVNLDNCPLNQPCPLSKMKEMYQKTNGPNKACEFEKICALNN